MGFEKGAPLMLRDNLTSNTDGQTDSTQSI